MAVTRDACFICGYQVSDGQKTPGTCPGCGRGKTFVPTTFSEKGDEGEGKEGGSALEKFHGVPEYAQVNNAEGGK